MSSRMKRLSMRKAEAKDREEEERRQQEQQQNRITYERSSQSENSDHEEEKSNFKSEPGYNDSVNEGGHYASTAAGSSIKKNTLGFSANKQEAERHGSQSIHALKQEELDEVADLNFYQQDRNANTVVERDQMSEHSSEMQEEDDNQAYSENKKDLAYDTNEEQHQDDMDNGESVDLDNIDRASKAITRSQMSESHSNFEVDEQHNLNLGPHNMNDDDSPLNKRRSIIEQTHDLRSLLNRIFAMRGGWKVKNLAVDFSDGFLFQELFNILYDEKIDCCLEGCKNEPNPKLPYETRVGNWNKINAGICFNYFQQQFFFVQGTMMTLARGKSGVLTAQAIRELLIAMQGTHHNTFDDAVDVRDIADLLRINI